MKIISPWREWDLVSRKDLVRYCNDNQLPIEEGSQNEPPFSTDENLLHISYEGGILEDITSAPPEVCGAILNQLMMRLIRGKNFP